MKTKQRALTTIEDNKLKQIRGYFESDTFKKELQKVIPEYLTPARLTRIALTEFRKNPELLKCTPESLLNSIMDCAQMGLEPSTVYNHVYLIPYGTECVAQPSSLGLESILRRNGINVISEVVYEDDEFSYQYTPDLEFRFVPSIKGKREKIIGAFAVAKEPTPDGYTYHMMYLSKAKIDKIMEASPGASSSASPWRKYYEEMACKSVIKKLSKRLASISEKIATAIAVDDSGSNSTVGEDIINNVTPIVENETVTYVEPQSKAEALADLLTNEVQENDL